MSTPDDPRSGPETWGQSRPALSVGDAPSEPVDPQGRYVREGLLGFGGMGRVYLAHDADLDREVALKQNTSGTEGAERLLREAAVMARLEHPGIVPIHELGHTPDGEPWYAMRVVRGRTLASALRDLDRPGRLALLRRLLAACEAVAYAHHQGIVHRDLKPANLMLGEFGETMVIDWGLARFLDEGEPQDDGLTRVGAVLGTPAYMSPEQARGEPLDRRADVWSLGVCLCELVRGAPPYAGSSDAIFRQVSAGQPPALAADEAPPALAAIVRQATAPDPDARYADASALAADLAAYLDGARVAAHDYSLSEEVGRAASAWRLPLAMIGAVLVVSLVGSLLFSARVADERDRAQRAQAEAAKAQQAAEARLVEVLSQHALLAWRQGRAAEAEVLAAEALTRGPSPQARGVWAALEAAPRPQLVSRTNLPPCAETAMSPSGGAFACLTDGDLTVRDAAPPFAVRWSRRVDGDRLKWWDEEALVVSSQRGPITLIDPTDNAVRYHTTTVSGARVVQAAPGTLEVFGHGRWGVGGFVREASAQLEGMRAKAVCADGTHWWVDADGRVLRGPFGRRAFVAATRMAGDHQAVWMRCAAKAVWLGGLRGDVALLARDDGEVLLERRTDVGFVQDVSLSGDGTRLAVVGESGDAVVLDVGTGLEVAQVPHRGLRHARLTSDGQGLVTLGQDHRTWSLPAAGGRTRHDGPSGLADIAVGDDGAVLLGATGGGELVIWRQDEDPVREVVEISSGVVKAADLAADGDRAVVATTRAPGLLRVDLTGARSPVVLQETIFRRVRLLDDGTVIALGWGQGPTVIDPSGAVETVHQQAGREFYDLDVSPARDAAVLLDDEGGLWRFDRTLDPNLQRVGGLTGAEYVAVDVRGRLAVAVGAEVVLWHETVRDWDRRFDGGASPITSLALSPDGEHVAAGHRDGRVGIWSTADGVLRARLEGHDERVSALRFSDDGDALFTGSWDAAVQRWSLSSLRAEPVALRADAGRRWGLSVDDALDAVRPDGG